jgi:hypothetical protein
VARPTDLHPNGVGLVKKWLEDGEIDGEAHVKGRSKRTWEVIRDSTLHTFRIEENPRYVDAMVVRDTLHLSADSMMTPGSRNFGIGPQPNKLSQVMPV